MRFNSRNHDTVIKAAIKCRSQRPKVLNWFLPASETILYYKNPVLRFTWQQGCWRKSRPGSSYNQSRSSALGIKPAIPIKLRGAIAGILLWSSIVHALYMSRIFSPRIPGHSSGCCCFARSGQKVKQARGRPLKDHNSSAWKPDGAGSFCDASNTTREEKYPLQRPFRSSKCVIIMEVAHDW